MLRTVSGRLILTISILIRIFLKWDPMDSQVSQGELRYVADSILNGIRLDLRKTEELRRIEILPIKNERSDNIVHIRKGLSEIVASLQFKENAQLLRGLNLITGEEFDKSEDRTPCLECSIPIPFDIKPWFSRFFEEFNLSISIDITIIKDDGGVDSLLFSALRMLFTNVRTPIFRNMREYTEKRISVPLPHCNTIAIKNHVLIEDPTLIEEMCSDSVVQVLRDCSNHVIGVFATGTQINISDVLNFLSNL
eukprot:jgi/Antlo1/1718/1869